MVTYNHGAYLAEAIEGVLKQRTDFPIELVIGEDFSTDNTRAIALGYQQSHPDLIRVVTSDRNVGGRANFRRIFEACTGEYIALCEGDDYWHHPDKLALQMALARTDRAISMIHGDYDRRIGDRIRRAVYRDEGISYPLTRDGFDDLLTDYRLITATTLYRGCVLRQFMSSAHHLQHWSFLDRPMSMYASLHGRIGFIEQSLATWRYNPGSATNSGLHAHLRMMQGIGQCHDRFTEIAGRTPDPYSRWRMKHETGTYGAAYLCGDVTAMNNSWQWLNSRGDAVPEWRHRVHQWLALLKIPLFWPRHKHRFRQRLALSRELKSRS